MDDQGVSLIFALLIVGVVAVVATVLVGQSFTNTATTISARQVASTQYAADAAARYAVNQVRLSDLSAGLCSSTTAVTTLDLPDFYPQGQTAVAQKAHVDCAPAPDNGQVPGGGGGVTCPTTGACPNASPGTALLTLDANPSRVGIYVNAQGPSPTIRIRGGVFSNSRITVNAGEFRNSWCPATAVGATTYDCTDTTPRTYVIAKGACSGTISFAQTGTTRQCNYTPANDPRGADPGVARTGYTPAASYGTPSPPTGLAMSQSCSASACTNDASPATSCASGARYQKVLPGLISGVAGLTFLNGLTGCANEIIQFSPGTYYFDLPAPWTPPAKKVVVGGTFAAGYNPVAGTGPNGWPGSGGYEDACVAPGAAAASTSSGVKFVVGGGTQFNVNDSSGRGSHLTICASNSADGPPIVLYGLKTAIGSGSMAVSASALCVPNGFGSTGCSLLRTANSPKTTINIVGMTYATRSVLSIVLNNASTKLFYWGVVSYAMEFDTTGSPDLSANLIDVQDAWPSPYAPTNRFFLNTFVCPVSAANCPASGAEPNVRAVVQVDADLNGDPLPDGNILVLSWSVNR
ncbi:hypothetical protein [Pimelobacter simplex]|uniref:hypothetical protein n=1 Tax=Nocardioides simplex TaxID=2045 RepID=UPI001EE417D3